MKVSLYYRRYGLHKKIKEIDLSLCFKDVYVKEDCINEDLLLCALPNEWLPVEPSKILLTVADRKGCGTGQRGLEKFMSWAKYFDSYVLELEED